MTQEYFDKHIEESRKQYILFSALKFAATGERTACFNGKSYSPKVMIENLLLFNDRNIIEALFLLDIKNDNINYENGTLQALNQHKWVRDTLEELSIKWKHITYNNNIKVVTRKFWLDDISDLLSINVEVTYIDSIKKKAISIMLNDNKEKKDENF